MEQQRLNIIMDRFLDAPSSVMWSDIPRVLLRNKSNHVQNIDILTMEIDHKVRFCLLKAQEMRHKTGSLLGFE